VEAVVGTFPAEVEAAYVVHRTDWIRKEFIRRTGGLWVDMDFVCWSDLAPLAEVGQSLDYLGWQEWHGTGWMDNFFAARADSPVLQTAAEFASAQLRQHGANVSWLATSSSALNHALDEVHPWCRWLRIPTHLVGPVSVMDVAWFTGESDTADAEVARYGSFGFMASVHSLHDWLVAQERNTFLHGRTRLAAIVRRGLGISASACAGDTKTIGTTVHA
jgi:hypothetical protein